MTESWASSPGRRRIMQAIRGRDTTPELAVRRILWSHGYRYLVDARPLPGLNRRADLVFRGPKVAVFIHGCFWHACPTHYLPPRTNEGYWSEKVLRNTARDRETNERLKKAGWRTVTLWEHEDPEKAAAKVMRAVSKRSGHGAQ